MSNRPKEFNGRQVTVKDNENINQALRRFKRKIDDSGILDDVKLKEHYIKPTTERKKDRAAAKSRWRKKLRDQELPKKLF